MILLTLSDLHLGKGLFFENGQLNIMEDFDEDERFYEFISFYCQGKYTAEEITLVLNGDIFNLIQIDVGGIFSPYITEDLTQKALAKIMKGHPLFFDALGKFLSTENKKVIYVIGNHDAGMIWQGPQKLLNQRVSGEVHFCQDINIFGVHIEHGHRFEAINAMPRKKYFMQGACGEEILNLPWGSLFCVGILPKLKKERPYIDRIRPMSKYVKWCLFHDFNFFVRMTLMVFKFILKTLLENLLRYKHRQLHSTINLLKQITIYPVFEKQAKRILQKNPQIHTVIMGHTHVLEWRKFPEGKYYFNSGTWNSIPSVDASMHQSEKNLSYIMLEMDAKNLVVSAQVNIWQGNWRPYRENVKMVPRFNLG